MSVTDKILNDKTHKTLDDNQRWMAEHREQTIRTGDVPIASEQASKPSSGKDVQQVDRKTLFSGC